MAAHRLGKILVQAAVQMGILQHGAVDPGVGHLLEYEFGWACQLLQRRREKLQVIVIPVQGPFEPPKPADPEVGISQRGRGCWRPGEGPTVIGRGVVPQAADQVAVGRGVELEEEQMVPNGWETVGPTQVGEDVGMGIHDHGWLLLDGVTLLLYNCTAFQTNVAGTGARP
jgi:hypothetical protein